MRAIKRAVMTESQLAAARRKDALNRRPVRAQRRPTTHDIGCANVAAGDLLRHLWGLEPRAVVRMEPALFRALVHCCALHWRPFDTPATLAARTLLGMPPDIRAWQPSS